MSDLSQLNLGSPPPGHREGIVMVYDESGCYLGCMGRSAWDDLLAEYGFSPYPTDKPPDLFYDEEPA